MRELPKVTQPVRLFNVSAGGVILMEGRGVQTSQQKRLSPRSQPSQGPSAKHHYSPLNPPGPWEVSHSRYHYTHFIDEEIEAQGWP